MSTRSLLIATVVVWGVALRGEAQEQPNAGHSLAEQITAVTSEFDTAMDEFITKYRAADRDEQKAMIASMPRSATYEDRVWALIDPDPKHADVAEGLAWVLQRTRDMTSRTKAARMLIKHHPKHEAIEDSIFSLVRINDDLVQEHVKALFAAKWQAIDTAPESAAAGDALVWLVASSRDEEDRVRAARLLFAHHPTHESLGDLVSSLARIDDDDVRAGIARLAEHSESREARGRALFALADGMLRARNSKGGKAGDANEKEIEAKLKQVVDEYGDLRTPRGSLGEQAGKHLTEMASHGVGRPAPDIAAEDTDGVAFRLSDYRGKAILLDFWGHW